MRWNRIGRIDLIELDTAVKPPGFALHCGRAQVTSQGPGILIFQPPPKVNSYNAFIEYATSFGVERLLVFSPEKRLR
jgi:hypothetical protein